MPGTTRRQSFGAIDTRRTKRRRVSISRTDFTVPPTSNNVDVSESSSTRPLITLNENKETACTTDGNIKVIARLRPLNQAEVEMKCNSVIVSESTANPGRSKSLVVIGEDQNKLFEFDDILEPTLSQEQVYMRVASNVIDDSIWSGINTTVLAYGQTGSGKTYTMGTDNSQMTSIREDSGLIPRMVHDLFARREAYGKEFVEIEVSYLEIYNEEMRDLLAVSDDDSDNNLVIRDNIEGGITVQNLNSVAVENPAEFGKLFQAAALKRSTGSTNMNAVSSRSHAICTIQLTIRPQKKEILEDDESGEVKNSKNIECTEMITSKLCLVDLAGSERIKRTGASGSRMKEGININKGLFVLGQVISTLSEAGKRRRSPRSLAKHVPYRDSKLTRILQDSLGGNSNTIMISCVSPADANLEESTNTLRYAQRARSIKNEIVRNVITSELSPSEAIALREENETLQSKLDELQQKLEQYEKRVTDECFVAMEKKIKKQTEDLRELQRQLESAEFLANVKDGVIAKLRAHLLSSENVKKRFEEELSITTEGMTGVNERMIRLETENALLKEQLAESIVAGKENKINANVYKASNSKEKVETYVRETLKALNNWVQSAE